ncbi:MAG: outer membrane beta-barrel protein [Flavobacteriales bacterium]|nr:outer membrane beta-barrel protein [Flavobacteriales bacterium]HRH70904.1 outer membrane beta-barrel protein [Flavobacteriales bacterium]
MKKILIALTVLSTVTSAQGQFQVNPQAGLTFQSLTDAPDGVNYKAAVGWQLGADARFGDRLFLQPGAFLGRSVTVVTTSGPAPNGAEGSVTVEDDLVRTNLKLRAQLGYRAIDSYQFDLRVMLGPSYDVLMSIDDRDGNLTWNEGNFNNGSFNIDLGVGFDMGLFTLSPTASFGLSRVFKDDPTLSQIDSKYMSYGLTLGINLGNDDE